MQEFKIDGHESSLLPEGEWSLCFSDEFDAPELDRTKWSFRRHLFHKPHPCWIEDEGLEFYKAITKNYKKRTLFF